MSIPSTRGGSLSGDCTVEIPLSDDLISSFCRRSRRRFREIQDATEAQVKLDRTRGVLRVSGSAEAVGAVQRQLESLGGPRIHVDAAVWAELMRTRTLQDSSLSAVAHLQEASGCRLHIERSRREVRLFGAADSVEIAEKILEDVVSRCVEVSVRSPGLPEGDEFSEVLEALANSCAVTFYLPTEMDGREGLVTVLGDKASVHTAAEELRRYFADPQNYHSSRWEKGATPPEVPLGVVTSKLPPAAAAGSTGEEEKQQQPARRPKAQLHAQKLQSAAQQSNFVLQQPKDKNLQQLHQELQQLQQLQQHLHVQKQNPQAALPEVGSKDHTGGCETCRTSCPTCGAARFCGACGAQLWQYPQLQLQMPAARPAMSLADWAMLNASSRLPKADDRGSGGGQMGGVTPDQPYPTAAWSQQQAMNSMGSSYSSTGMYGGVPAGMMGVYMMPGSSSATGPGAGMQPCIMPAAMLPMMTPACAESLGSGSQNYTMGQVPANFGQLAGS